MYRKSHLKAISFVAVASISISCLGQQVQEAVRSPAPLGSDRAGASQNATQPNASTTVQPAIRALAPRREPVKGLPVLRSIFGQRADVGIFTVGNFNQPNFIHLDGYHPGSQEVVSMNKSSLGGGAEYRWKLSDRNTLGFLYVQNPSDIKLFVGSAPPTPSGQSVTTQFISPLMRWDISVLATQSFKAGKFTPFVCEGPGVLLSNGYSNSGWSHGFAFVGGVGVERRVNPQFSIRQGITFLDTRSGCYNDPTCHATWGVSEDIRIGIVYKWSGRESRLIAREDH